MLLSSLSFCSTLLLHKQQFAPFPVIVVTLNLVFAVGSRQSTALTETALSDETFAIRFNVQRPSLYCQLDTSVMINSQHFSSDSRATIRCTQSTV